MKSAVYSISTTCSAGTSQNLTLAFPNMMSRITVYKIFLSSLLVDSLGAYKQINRLAYTLAANVSGQLIGNSIPNTTSLSNSLGVYGNENTSNVIRGPFTLNPGTSYIIRTTAYGTLALNDVLSSFVNVIYE